MRRAHRGDLRSAQEVLDVLKTPQSIPMPDGTTWRLPSGWSTLTLEQDDGLLGHRYRFVGRIDRPLREQAYEAAAAAAGEAMPDETRDLHDLVLASVKTRFAITFPGLVGPATLQGPATLSPDGRTVT